MAALEVDAGDRKRAVGSVLSSLSFVGGDFSLIVNMGSDYIPLKLFQMRI